MTTQHLPRFVALRQSDDESIVVDGDTGYASDRMASEQASALAERLTLAEQAAEALARLWETYPPESCPVDSALEAFDSFHNELRSVFPI